MGSILVDEAGFADILKQVRDHQFEEELKNRLSLAEKEKYSEIKLAEAILKNSLQGELSKKDQEITELKAKNEIANNVITLVHKYFTLLLLSFPI